MTERVDTDRLRALAEAAQEKWLVPIPAHSGAYKPPDERRAYEAAVTPLVVLALLAENERMREALEAEHEDRCGCEEPGRTAYCVAGPNFAALAAVSLPAHTERETG